KREQIDDDIWETALRESNEEIGLEIQTASKIGQLDRFTSRFGLEVTPCVALVSDQHWQAAANEVAAVFTMPIERLLHDEPDSVDHFHKEGQEMFVPRWRSAEGMEIWGLTARITVEFLRQACGDQRTLTNW
ncbi:MAG: NUDIX hydrolase, partial [Gammaproteobacteria bacterium]